MHVVAHVITPPNEVPDVDVKKITVLTPSPAVEEHVNELVEESDLVTSIWNRPALLLTLSDESTTPPEISNSPVDRIT